MLKKVLLRTYIFTGTTPAPKGCKTPVDERSARSFEDFIDVKIFSGKSRASFKSGNTGGFSGFFAVVDFEFTVFVAVDDGDDLASVFKDPLDTAFLLEGK